MGVCAILQRDPSIPLPLHLLAVAAERTKPAAIRKANFSETGLQGRALSPEPLLKVAAISVAAGEGQHYSCLSVQYRLRQTKDQPNPKENLGDEMVTGSFDKLLCITQDLEGFMHTKAVYYPGETRKYPSYVFIPG